MNARARILLVDDEPRVLEGLERTLGDDYDIATATSGRVALDTLRGDGPFAVIMSDMRMPEMDGAVFLSRAQQLAPDTTRVLLTGHADMSSAISAVNDGHVFRFLAKPCPHEILRRHLDDAIAQHRLVTAERDLLERTVTGAVELLTELLAMTAPALFSRASRIRATVRGAAQRLELANAWEAELAALLCLIGCMSLPPELVEKVWAGVRLAPDDRALFDHHPVVGHKLLSAIPRLDRVAEIVRRQRNATKTGDAGLDAAIALLRAALDGEELAARGLVPAEIRDELLRRMHATSVVSALLPERGDVTAGVTAVPLNRLAAGVVLDRDVTTSAGAVLVKAGSFVSATLVERLRKYATGVGVVDPIYVRAV